MTTTEVTLAPGGTPTFVGRNRELEWLRTLLAAAGQGEARLALVGGEPGVGKTSLVREFLSEADAAGWQTVWGRCSEDAVTPHQPFATGLIPQLRKAGIVTGNPSDDLAVLQQDALEMVAASLAEQTVSLAKRRPLLFVIDDFQFGEPGTLTLIREFVRNLSEIARKEPLRLLVVVTHHPPLPGDAFGAFLERLRVEPIAASLKLTGLSDLEVHELVRLTTSASCDPRLLGALVEATHGNPFFLLQVLRHLERGNLLVREGSYVTTKGKQFDLHFPVSAASSVTHRIEESSNELLRPIQTAALLGDEFELDDLAPFHSQMELDAAIDHGVSSGLLVETTSGFAFSHGMIRTAIVESIGPMRRRKAHTEIATHLIAKYGETPERSLVIANHVSAAGKWPDESQAGAIFERAGDYAMASFIWAAGHRFYEAALGLEGYVASLDAGSLGRLYAKTARANGNNGDRERSHELYRLANRLLRDAADIDGWGRALLALWRSLENGSEPIPDDGAYEEFSEAAGEDFLETRAQLLMKRAETLSFARDSRDQEAGEQALELSRQSSDPETRAYALVVMGLIHNRHLRPNDAVEMFEAGATAAEPIRNPRIRGWSASRLAMPLIVRGDLPAARAACANARAIAQAGHDLTNGPLNLALFHTTAVLAGEYDLARNLRLESAMLGTRATFPAALFVLDAAVAWERLLRGEYDESADAVAAWETVGGRSISRTLKLLVLARSGEHSHVREELANRSLVLGTSGVDFDNAGPIAAAGELAIELDLPEVAERVFELLGPVVRRGVVFSVNPPILLARVVSSVARMTGRMQEAVDSLAIAELAARSGNAAPELGLVCLERAKLLTALGAPTHKIGDAVAEAAAIFRKLDMVGASSWLREFVQHSVVAKELPALLAAHDDLSASELDVLEEFSKNTDIAAMADRLLLSRRTVESHLARCAKRLGINSPEAARGYLRAARPDAATIPAKSANPALAELTKREIEVLGLIARGFTNQQIADELVLSPHTAIRHVANILGKTGAANRTEAARLVVAL